MVEVAVEAGCRKTGDKGQQGDGPMSDLRAVKPHSTADGIAVVLRSKLKHSLPV